MCMFDANCGLANLSAICVMLSTSVYRLSLFYMTQHKFKSIDFISPQQLPLKFKSLIIQPKSVSMLMRNILSLNTVFSA